LRELLRIARGLERIAQRAAEIVEARAAKPEAERPYLSVRETADYLRCSRQRVYDLLSQGALRRLKDGARVLVARDELDAYLRGVRTGQLARHDAMSRDATRVSGERRVPPAEPGRLFSSDAFRRGKDRRSPKLAGRGPNGRSAAV
jgi:excisionase family DNA binding protein